MKRNHLALSVLAAAGMALPAMGQISGSKHDFSATGWAGGEICRPCHTPHDAPQQSTVGMLWNHDLTVETGFTMYDGTSGTAVGDFSAKSRLCLSCHDGSVALDSFGGTTGTNFIPAGAKVGPDLQADHPVGSAAIYPGLPDYNATPNNGLVLEVWNDGTADQDVVACTTCHEPHNKGNLGNMLAHTNAVSALCLSCHIK